MTFNKAKTLLPCELISLSPYERHPMDIDYYFAWSTLGSCALFGVVCSLATTPTHKLIIAIPDLVIKACC